MSKRAFTLAEVLITLGIIGVVAAMTIPALINNTNQKELKTAWKKAYSELSQASLLILNEDPDFFKRALNGELTNDEFQATFDEHLSVVKTCDNSNIAGNCFAEEFYSPDGTNSWSATDDGMVASVLNNGTAVSYSLAQAGMFVDVNGLKKPNVVGKDIFMVDYDCNGSSENDRLCAYGYGRDIECPSGGGWDCSFKYLTE